MKPVLIVVFLVGFIYASSATQFAQIIKGKGELVTKVDTNGAHAAVNGYGDQGYVLYIRK